MNIITTTPDFWDCACDIDYIHPASEESCTVCGESKYDCADSRVNEVLEKLAQPKYYVLYCNDNGTDAYPLGSNEDPTAKAQELIKEHEDDPNIVVAFYAEIENNKFNVLYALNVDDDECDCDGPGIAEDSDLWKNCVDDEEVVW